MVQQVGVDLEVVQTPSTTFVRDDDGGVHVRTVQAGPGAVRFTFASPGGSNVSAAGDRSVAVVDADGALWAGLGAPVVTAADGSILHPRWTAAAADGTTLALDLVTAETESSTSDRAESAVAVAYPVTVDVYLGRTVVSSVEWGNREGGTSLAVTPTPWGRESGSTGRTYGWADVVRLEPTADTSVMRNQFLCHVDGARQKDTWNLEPWRPDVSFIDYLLARCNPT